MSNPSVPEASAKIGAKIDFVVKQLAKALKPHGFTCRARVLTREQGAGPGRCVHILDVQADKWNQGSSGRFTLNLGACFPALLDLQKDLPGLEWLTQVQGSWQVAFGPAGFVGRLGDAVSEQRDARWPEALKPQQDYWAEIGADTDLADLSARLIAAVLDLALPWWAARSDLAAFQDESLRGWQGPGARERALAAMLSGDLAQAGVVLKQVRADQLAQSAKQFQALLTLLQQYGIDTQGLAWAEAPAHPMQARRAQAVANLKSEHQSAVSQFLDAGLCLPDQMDAFLDAFVHEDAANQLASEVAQCRLWAIVLAANHKARRALLSRLLTRMPEPGPTIQSTVTQVWASYPDYHVHAWSRLAVALLALDQEPLDGDELRHLLAALSLSVGRVIEGMMSDEFRAPVAAIIQWLKARTDPATRFAAKPAFQELLSAISEATLARSRERSATMPSREALGEELWAILAKEDRAATQAKFERLYAECPERGYASKDRDAILLIKRWLRADETGQVPLQIEADDWGIGLQAAIKELPETARASVCSLLTWFDESADSKPSKRWWAELDRRRAALSTPAMTTWLSTTLPRFADTRLEHFLLAPGYLALPGETSERLALGMAHWAGQIEDERLSPALETMAQAAFQVIPGQRMRAYAVGLACLNALARVTAGQAALLRIRQAHRQKTVRAAIDKLLA